MGRELARFGLTCALALVIGLITGYVLPCLLVATSGLLLWQTKLLADFKNWLVAPKKYPFPDTDSIVQDLVSEVQRLRKSNRSRKRKLARYLKEFRTTFEAIPDAMVMIDDTGQIEWINPAAGKYLGIQWPGDAGNRINNIVRDPGFAAMFTRNQDSPGRLSEGFEVEILSPVLKDIYLSVNCTRYGNHSFLVMARDVTRLVDAHQARSDFVANVSHELRTPLTVLYGYLETLLDQPGLPENFVQPMENMKNQSQRMQAIVEDLLFLSKLEQESPPDFEAQINIAALLAEIQDSARALGDNKKLMIELEIDPDLQLLGSIKEIHSAFSNLVFNMPKGSHSVSSVTQEEALFEYDNLTVYVGSWSRKIFNFRGEKMIAVYELDENSAEQVKIYMKKDSEHGMTDSAVMFQSDYIATPQGKQTMAEIFQITSPQALDMSNPDRAAQALFSIITSAFV
jgi:two-component system phosphate regulon sensor histidine kinase PhoR